ncbi:double-strand break repair protein AddB [Oecophyllibacter saccharovorans]|uniref:double-strand break repair protein AddB n=1 Tax=Oecophyllibacter saccharovorans TaxID=2558360 RepID=UPI0011451243|nr:double-strand break repair protein AddB [Oecophyllibacter saccharovorans]QDH15409.1 double-strand break repair protein AddB [Oecophyllibacter saccharovorans]
MSGIATLAATEPFLDRIAQEWLQRYGARDEGGAAGGRILVPGRRAARALQEAFLRVLDGRAALLPAITPLGDLEEETLFAMDLEARFPPAVDPTHRLVVLTQLVLKAPLARIADNSEGALERAWPLAQALAQLMDEAERAGVDLAHALPTAVAEDYAEHWQETLVFLEIVTKFWPAWLQEQGFSNPVARQVSLLRAQAEAWLQAPPEGPLWAAGFVDGSGGVAELLGAVARAPEGCVILQGVDLKLNEPLWESLPQAHPQALLRDLLTTLEVPRSRLEVWAQSSPPAQDSHAAREGLMRQVMLPEQGLFSWGRQQPHSLLAAGVEGLSLLTAEDTQQEAQVIALALRAIAEQPGRRASLVTPDLSLARRVETELLRFGIHADNSAGEPLSGTPPAVFLRLVADAAASQLAPVALLAVLKHPLASLGLGAGRARASARLLERQLLRGPSPPPGIAGLRQALAEREKELEKNTLKHGQDGQSPERGEDPASWGSSADAPHTPAPLKAFLDRIEQAFAPLLALEGDASLPDLLTGLVQAAEALAALPEEAEEESSARPGAQLWRGDDGRLLSRHLAELMAHGEALPGQRLNGLEAFLTVSMAGKSLTGLRGHQQGVALAHPRISILGVLEARLMAFDTVILGALTEASWPPATDPGPWLSRPMRQRVGLPSPERRLGASAHDFLMSVLASRQVLLSAPARREGSPAVRARWLTRLQAYLSGQEEAPALPAPAALAWQQVLDRPLHAVATPVAPPRPRPPLALRPRRLSITEIDLLKRDPYAIYGRHILKLRPLPPLEEGVDHAHYGLVVHAALEEMFRRHPQAWPADARRELADCFERALKAQPLRPALVAWWRPRLERIADWVVAQELPQRLGGGVWTTAAEAKVRHVLHGLPGGSFTLTGRADRIDLAAMHDGAEDAPAALRAARVFDYKTGTPPRKADVALGWDSQMVLEAALLARGYFPDLPAARAESLVYWQLQGGPVPGRVHEMPGRKSALSLDELVDGALDQLAALIGDYDNPRHAYLSHPWAEHTARFTDYAQLARVSEWRSGSR